MNQRTDMGLTQKDMASLTGVSVSAISMHEKGKRRLPKSAQHVMQIIDNREYVENCEKYLSQAEFDALINNYDERIRLTQMKVKLLGDKLEVKKITLAKQKEKVDRHISVFSFSSVMEQQGVFRTEIKEKKNALARAVSKHELFYNSSERIFNLETEIDEMTALLEVRQGRLNDLIAERDSYVAHRETLMKSKEEKETSEPVDVSPEIPTGNLRVVKNSTQEKEKEKDIISDDLDDDERGDPILANILREEEAAITKEFLAELDDILTWDDDGDLEDSSPQKE